MSEPNGLTLPWIPTMKEVDALAQILKDNDATIAALTASVAELEASLTETVHYVGESDIMFMELTARIAELEAQLAEALKPKPMRVMQVPDFDLEGYLNDNDE